MIREPNFASLSPLQTLVAATAAGAIAIGIFSGIVLLSEQGGKPLERLAAAERVCAHSGYMSERQMCMKEWLTQHAGKSHAVASR